MASEPFGRRQGQIVPDCGDVDAVIDCLLNSIRRLCPCLADSSFWFRCHALIVALAEGGINRQVLMAFAALLRPMDLKERLLVRGGGGLVWW